MLDGRDVGKEFQRFRNLHFQDVIDVFAFINRRKGLLIEALSFCKGAFDPGVFHEVHVDFDHAHAVALGAGALFDIKAEAAGLIAARLAFGQLAEEVADFIEKLDIGGRIGAGIAPDRGLVDGDHFVDLFDAL